MPRFVKGGPGGPGRPPGSRNKVPEKIDRMVRESLEQAVLAVGRAAARGEANAARRLPAGDGPRVKARVIELDLPAFAKPADFIATYAALAAAIGNAEVPPGQATAVAAAPERPRLTGLGEMHGAKPAR